MDLAAAAELVNQSSAAAGAGGGAVGVVTGGIGVAFLARLLFKRMIDQYDQAIKDLIKANKDESDKHDATRERLAKLEAIAAERQTRVADVEARAAILEEKHRTQEFAIGVAHRRLEAVAAGNADIFSIKSPDRQTPKAG